MATIAIEYCTTCGEPTGRAGRSEDSIYCDHCDEGPFCVSCLDAHGCTVKQTEAE